MAQDNTKITPPRPPEGNSAPQQTAGADSQREQLNADSQAPKPPAKATGTVPPEPNPPPPDTSNREDPEPGHLPDEAHKKFPQTHYASSGPVDPPPKPLP